MRDPAHRRHIDPAQPAVTERDLARRGPLGTHERVGAHPAVEQMTDPDPPLFVTHHRGKPEPAVQGHAGTLQCDRRMDHRGNTRLAVRRAAPVHATVVDVPAERLAAPGEPISDRHGIEVPVEPECRPLPVTHLDDQIGPAGCDFLQSILDPLRRRSDPIAAATFASPTGLTLGMRMKIRSEVQHPLRID